MDRWQDSLLRLGKDMFTKQGEAERIEKNFSFVKTLVSALKERHSFLYKFRKLNMISLIESPDQQFRIFSWNIPLNDGSFLYYGAIQTKTKSGELQLVPLLDKTFEIKKPESMVLLPNNWYGAQYYDIVSLGDSYALLGWKGHNPLFSQKVIEILQYKEGQYHMGKAVFADDPQLVRKIFNFTREATMYLRYEAENSRIVFDHIVPADSSLIGKYQYYGPDLSHDAYSINAGILTLERNVLFKNIGRGDEPVNNTPGKAIKGKKSGL